jgi:hypothetical protein
MVCYIWTDGSLHCGYGRSYVQLKYISFQTKNWAELWPALNEVDRLLKIVLQFGHVFCKLCRIRIFGTESFVFVSICCCPTTIRRVSRLSWYISQGQLSPRRSNLLMNLVLAWTNAYPIRLQLISRFICLFSRLLYFLMKFRVCHLYYRAILWCSATCTNAFRILRRLFM